ncbi:hypothetical protein DPMN_105152 [Dreissena polymorpha]|uniref:Uncharacterized protein n=1 Tax=Dreissena polymorpha TaxID=45954 RepID=A0A9D4HBA8_DREPO|nr:hypothetical protein DPMN_105152 [Dreissena polymorpha]
MGLKLCLNCRPIGFTSPAELTGHQKLYSMTDSEAPSALAQSCREDRCLCRLHGIEHLRQTDTFQSLSETELEPRNHRSRCDKRLKAHVCQ